MATHDTNGAPSPRPIIATWTIVLLVVAAAIAVWAIIAL